MYARKNYGLAFSAAVMFSAGVGVLATSQAADASLTGFGSDATVTTSSPTVNNGDTYTEDNGTVTLNANDNAASDSVPSVGTNGSNLHLTNYASNDAGSAWFNEKQNIATPWQTSFTYTFDGGTTGMGFYFAVQNASDGVHVLGAANRGYGLTADNAGAPPNHTLGIGVDNSNNGSQILFTYADGNGNEIGGYDNEQDASSSGINFGNGGSPADITISYDGNMSLTFSATQDGNTFNHTYTLPETLSTLVNGDAAYIGFTGSTDNWTESQDISDFSFSAVPEPASLVLLALAGALLLLSRGRAKA